MVTYEISAASLDNPLYYQSNAAQVVAHCLIHYRRLLKPDEIALLEQFQSLPDTTQALFVRMLMRKGCFFRTDNLQYEEIPTLEKAIQELTAVTLVNINPLLAVSDLGSILKKDECKQLCIKWLDVTSVKLNRKADMLALLQQHFGDVKKTMSDWWPEAPFEVIELEMQSLFDRLLLLFFGNLRQSWSTFVLSELGLQTYEKVALTEDSMAFHNRDELDYYEQLGNIFERLESGEAVDALYPLIPEQSDNAWLENRRSKLCFLLGRQAEREKSIELAQRFYADSAYPEAIIRHLRLQEKEKEPHEVYQLANSLLDALPQPQWQESLYRIMSRTARRSNISFAVPNKPAIATVNLTLHKTEESSVENAVIEHLRDENTHLYHVENRLFTGLFALLFWRVIFAPVSGAFFNPFQSGPADLYREGFTDKRQNLIEETFDLLNTDAYISVIKENLTEKQGISCRLIHWPTLQPELVEMALELIPASHLSIVFRYLLLDLRNHSSGMPDLIMLTPHKKSYSLIEVKGPSDRLQDHQRYWITSMIEQGLPVSVCHVSWKAAN